MVVVPYKNSGSNKKEQVASMFDNIASSYDFLNHLLSLNIDKIWRRKAVKILKPYHPQNILDIATGTGDFAMAVSRLKPRKIIGVDISSGMLKVGHDKIKRQNLDELIELQEADSEYLPFKNNSFSAAICAFGVRNFENLDKGLKEVYRVLTKEGVFIILEFSIPENTIFNTIFNFYFKKVLPRIGKIISKDQNAYKYLPESVEKFPSGSQFLKILHKNGFINNRMIPLSKGVATIYVGEKHL